MALFRNAVIGCSNQGLTLSPELNLNTNAHHAPLYLRHNPYCILKVDVLRILPGSVKYWRERDAKDLTSSEVSHSYLKKYEPTLVKLGHNGSLASTTVVRFNSETPCSLELETR